MLVAQRPLRGTRIASSPSARLGPLLHGYDAASTQSTCFLQPCCAVHAAVDRACMLALPDAGQMAPHCVQVLDASIWHLPCSRLPRAASAAENNACNNVFVRLVEAGRQMVLRCCLHGPVPPMPAAAAVHSSLTGQYHTHCWRARRSSAACRSRITPGRQRGHARLLPRSAGAWPGQQTGSSAVLQTLAASSIDAQ